VRLNGIDYGLHLNVETMDDVALKRNFGDFDDPQHLYEGQAFVDLAPGSAGMYEVDEGDEGDLSDLEALIAAANATSPGLSERMAPVADLEQMTRMWAVERYIAHWDGYSGYTVSNHFLYSDPNGVFQVLPWGTDQTFYRYWHPFDGGEGKEEEGGGTLFEQCLAEEACLAKYTEDLVATDELVKTLDLSARTKQLAALLTPWQTYEITHSERAPFRASQIGRSVDDIIFFLTQRPGDLADWLGIDVDPGEPENEPVVLAGGGGASGAKPAPNPSLAAIPRLSRRLSIDRSQLHRGLLTVRASVSDPGKLTQRAELVTLSGRLTACATSQRAHAPGTLIVVCRLSAEVRRHLATRWLRLEMLLRFQPLTGEATDLRTTVRLPREPAPWSRPQSGTGS
jgi:CotH kinase protein